MYKESITYGVNFQVNNLLSRISSNRWANNAVVPLRILFWANLQSRLRIDFSVLETPILGSNQDLTFSVAYIVDKKSK